MLPLPDMAGPPWCPSLKPLMAVRLLAIWVLWSQALNFSMPQVLLPVSTGGYKTLEPGPLGGTPQRNPWTNQVMSLRIRKALATDSDVPEGKIYQRLRAKTAELFPGGVHMLPSSSRGRLLTKLAEAAVGEGGKILEVGTFTGYSALCFADAGAQVVTIERCPFQAEAAREFLQAAGAPVLVLEGLAQQLLPQLAAAPTCYDVIHLDGAMKSYEDFLNLALEGGLLAEHGMVLADNVLFRGMVTAVSKFKGGGPLQVEETRLHHIARKLHAFNFRFLHDDVRTEGLILDQDDGLAIIWRRLPP